MRYFLLLFLLFSIDASSQSVEETFVSFSIAVQSKNHEEVISKGLDLLDYVEKFKILDDSILLDKYDTSIFMVMRHVANSYESIDSIEKSLDLNLKNKQFVIKRWGDSSYILSLLLSNLANNYSSLNNHQKSIDLYLSALSIRENLFGKQNPRYSNILLFIALEYEKLNDYKKVNEAYIELLTICYETNGIYHPFYLFILNKLGLSYSDIGLYQKAIETFEKAKIIVEEVYGKNDSNNIAILNNLGQNYHYIGEYEKAIMFLSKSKKITQNIHGKHHPSYCKVLNNLTNSYIELGKLDSAFITSNESLIIGEKLYGKKHQQYARILKFSARYYSEIGAYKTNIGINLDIIKIMKNTIGINNSEYLTIINNLGYNYSKLGKLKESKKYYFEALNKNQKLFGKEHPTYALSLNNLAHVYSDLGDFNNALKLNQEALFINEKVFGKEHPTYALSLNNLAAVYSHLGDFNKALKLNQESLSVREKVFGREHPTYALSLNNLANNYYNLAEFKKSLQLQLETLAIREKTIGKVHADYAMSIDNLSFIYFAIGDYNKALKFKLNAYSILKTSYDKNKFGLSPSLKSSLKVQLETCYHILASLSCINDSAMLDLYNNWIGLNGIIGSDNQALIQKLVNTKDSTLVTLFDELRSSQAQLMKYNELTFQEKEKRGIETQPLEQEIQRLESELSFRSKDFAELNRTFSSQDVVQELNDDEVLIDIVRFPYYNFKQNKWSDSIKYLVFISNKDDTLVDHLIIQTGKELEEDVYSEYTSFTSGDNKLSNQKDKLSYKYFWKPISDRIGSKKTVYVSLSGIYNNINLSTLYNPDTEQYLFEEKDIRIVKNSRDFILRKQAEKETYTNNTAVLVGYPNYDGGKLETNDSLNFIAESRDLSSFWIDSLNRGGNKVYPLPGTKREVENIKSKLDSNDWSVQTFTGDEATESRLKQIDNPRILHIATHGYFFEDVPNQKNDATQFMGVDKVQFVENPMLRSGLIFTGANKTLKGEEIVGENGLLSSLEATLLNLDKTELVVLSACETGKGKVKNSEGVYGLQKALFDAGAENVIMSLWKVNDKVTQEFMETFYSQWLVNKNIRQSFIETQKLIKLKYPQPYFWGAFILIGQ